MSSRGVFVVCAFSCESLPIVFRLFSYCRQLLFGITVVGSAACGHLFVCFLAVGRRQADGRLTVAFPQRVPGGTQEALKKHPRREASGRPLGGPRDALKCPKSRMSNAFSPLLPPSFSLKNKGFVQDGAGLFLVANHPGPWSLTWKQPCSIFIIPSSRSVSATPDKRDHKARTGASEEGESIFPPCERQTSLSTFHSLAVKVSSTYPRTEPGTAL